MPFLARTHPRLSSAAVLGLAVGLLAPADTIISKILIGSREVMMIGRRRRRAAFNVASIRSSPWSYRSLANSMIRIAFFADSPMIVIRPTLKNTSLGIPRKLTANTAPSTPRGTTSSTEVGIDQLSYSAARHRNTISSDKPSSSGAWEPDKRS